VVFCRQQIKSALDLVCCRVLNKYNLSLCFGKRKDVVFKELQALLKPFNIKRYYTDDWGAYERNIPTNEHEIGRANPQKIGEKI